MSITMTKWGNNLGIRIPKAIVSELDLKEGSSIDISVQNGTIILRPEKLRYILEEMVQQMEGKYVPEEIDFGMEGNEKI